MTTPTVTELVRNGNRVGKRVELARYTIPAGERVLYGQRINGVVRFLPANPVVLVSASAGTENDSSSSWLEADDGRADAVRQKRPRRCAALAGRPGDRWEAL